jgi:hypothetical protein
MNEAQLIKQFQEILIKIDEKESMLKYLDSAKAKSLTEEIKNLAIQKEYIISQLKICTDKTLTAKKVKNVKEILIQLNRKFSQKEFINNLSREQRTVAQSHILIKIRDDIHSAFKNHEKINISEYFLESESDFKTDELLNIFQESIHILNSKEINDYIALCEFMKLIEEKITTLDPACGRINI